MFYRIFYGLRQIGNQLPYFTITANEHAILPSGRVSCRNERWGRLDDVIVKTKYKDILSLVLCNMNGEPMHSFANGMWFLGYSHDGEHSKYEDCVYKCDSVMRHFRIDKSAADALHELLERMHATERVDFLNAYIESCKPRWKAEADAVIQKYGLTVDKEER